MKMVVAGRRVLLVQAVGAVVLLFALLQFQIGYVFVALLQSFLKLLHLFFVAVELCLQGGYRVFAGSMQN